MAGAKVSSYLKNVAKSIGYATADVFESYAPTMTRMARNTKETSESIYQSIKDFTSKSSSSNFNFKAIKNKAGEFARNSWKNSIEDLKTGKYYNKERKDAADMDLMAGFGIDFNFDFDDEDWGDFDNDGFDEQDSTKAQVASNVATTKAVISSVNEMGRGIADTIVSTNEASTNYIVDTNRENTQALYDLNKHGFGTITQALQAVNETIYNFSKIGEPLTAHMQNSSIFFTKTSESLSHIEQSLKQIEKNTTPPPSATSSRGSKSRKTTLASLISDDSFDFGGLFSGIKESIDEYKETIKMFTDFIKPTMSSGGKNMSPVSWGLKAVVEKVLSSTIKDSIVNLDKSLGLGLSAGMIKALTKAKGGFGPLGILASMILPEMGNEKRTYNTSNYEKGPVAWDGVARHALTNVIPTILLQTYAAITGTNPLRYDYSSGKFVSAASISSEFAKTKRKYIEEAGGDFYKDVKNKISKSNLSSSDKKKQLDEMEKFFEHLFDKGDFNIYANNASTYGISDETLAVIRGIMTGYDTGNAKAKKNKNKLVVNMTRGSAAYSNYIKDQEDSGFALMAMLHDEMNGESKAKKKGNTSTIFGLDQYGHNYYFYLQGIWQFTKAIRDNYKGGPTGGGKKRKGKGATSRTGFGLPEIPMAFEDEVEVTDDEVLAPFVSSIDEAEEAGKRKEENVKGLKKWISGLKIYQNEKSFIGRMLRRYTGEETSALSAIGIVNSISTAIDTLMFGTEEEPDKGLFGFLFTKAGELFKGFKDKMTDFWNSAKEKVTDWWKKMFEPGGVLGGFWEETKAVLGAVGGSIRNTLHRGVFGTDYVKKPKPSEQGRTNDVPLLPPPAGGAAKGRKVTKSGVVTVSEGEMIIPSELNPFYHGATNKNAQIRREQYIRGKYLGEFRDGGMPEFTGPTLYGQAIPEEDALYDRNGKRRSFTKKSLLGMVFLGAVDAFSGLKSWISKETDKKKIEESKNKMKEMGGKLLDDFGVAKGRVGAGAILGFGGSALLGGILGPLAGAALGAGIGFLSKSETAQDMIFGKVDPKTGEREKQKLYDFMMKEAPGLGKGAAIGGGIGLFMGSPVLGAFLGAGIGFAKESTRFQDWLFGKKDENGERTDTGAIPKPLQDAIKKAAPRIAFGASLGLLAGPFGLVGNVLLGSSIGFASTTNKFHDFLFGDKGDGEENKKSLTYVIKHKIFGGLDTFFHNMGNRFKIWSRELGMGIARKIHKWANKLTDDSKNGTGSGSSRLLGGVLRAAGFIAGMPIRTVGRVTDFMARKSEKKNLKKGYSAWDRYAKRNMTAKERLSARNKYNIFLGDNFEKFDAFLADIKDYQQLKDYKELINDLKIYPEDSEQFQEAADKLMNDERFKKFMGGKASIKFIKKNINRMEQLLADEGGRKGFSPEEAKELSEIKFRESVTEDLHKIFERLTKGIKIIDKDESEDVETDTTMYGIVQYRHNRQGELVEDTSDKETQASIRKRDKFFDSINKIPLLGGLFTKLFGKKKEEGEEGEEKEGLLSKIFDWVKDKFGGLLDTLKNLKIGGLSLGSALPGIAVGAGLASLLFGDPDSGFNKIVNNFAESIGMGGSDTGTFKTSDIESSDGRQLYYDEATGTYYDKDGNEVDYRDVMVRRSDEDAFTSRFRKTNLRQLVTGKQTLAGAIFGKTKFGKMVMGKAGGFLSGTKAAILGENAFRMGEQMGLDTAHTASAIKTGRYLGSVDDIAGDIASSKAAAGALSGEWERGFKSVMSSGETVETIIEGADGAILGTAKANIDDAAKGILRTNMEDGLLRFANVIEKIPVLRKIVPAIKKSLPELAEKMSKSIAKAGAKVASTAAKAIPILNIAIAVADFTTGYEDARTTLGITKDPSFGQRILAGLLRLIKNLIPFVGPLIPDSLVINVFCDYIAPALGMDPSQLMADREEALQTVAEYNESHGTDYDVSGYNKSVLHDYTFTERIGNTIRTTKQQFKDAGKHIKEVGIGGYLAEGGTAFADTFMDSISETGNVVTGAFTGLGSLFKKLLPGVLGEIPGKWLDIMGMAFNGDIAGIWDEKLDEFKGGQINEDGIKTADTTLISKIVGAVPLLPAKLIAMPIAGISWVGKKVGEFIGGIAKKVGNTFKQFGSGFAESFKRIANGEDESMTYIDDVTDDEGNPLSGFEKGVRITGRILAYPFGFIAKIAKPVVKVIKDIGLAVFDSLGSTAQTVIQSVNLGILSGDPGAMWSTPLPEADPRNPLGFIPMVVGNVFRVVSTPISVASWIGHQVWDIISGIGEKIATGFGDLVDVSGNIIKAGIVDGDPGAMWSTPVYEDDEGNDTGAIIRTIATVEKVALTIPSVISWAGHQVWGVVSELFDEAKKDYDSMKTSMGKVSEYADNSDFTGILGEDFEAANPVTGFIFKFGLSVYKVGGMIKAGIKLLGNVIRNMSDSLIEESGIGAWVTDVLGLDNSVTLAERAQKLDTIDTAEQMYRNESNNLKNDSKGYLTGGNEIGSIDGKQYKDIDFGDEIIIDKKNKTQYSKYSVRYIVNPDGTVKPHGVLDREYGEYVNASYDGKKAILRNAAGVKVAEFGDSTDPSTFISFVGNVTATGGRSGIRLFGGASGRKDISALSTGLTGLLSGKSFVNQTNPIYDGLSIGGKPVSEAGCGPAVASMAVSSLGGNLSMADAVDATRGYTGGNGVSTEYFSKVFSSRGLSTTELNGTENIKQTLSRGTPVVLLGRDAMNRTKDNSPFGPNNHFVLANGMVGNKVIISDPEQPGPRLYDSRILNNTESALSGSVYGMGSGGFSDTTTAQNIWAYLTGVEGLSPAGAAGIMGCWDKESGLNPDTFEGYYLGGAPSREQIASRQALSNYTSSFLFPAYANSGLSINDSYYNQGTRDGLYYPGLGLAQWTGVNGERLLDMADKKGLKWYDLDTQMQMFSNDLNGVGTDYYTNLGTKSMLQSATDPSEAAATAAKYYEGYNGDYSSRRQSAVEVYNAYSGKNYTYSGSASPSSSGDSNANKSYTSSGGDILSVLTEIFGSLGSIFDFVNGFHFGSLDSGDSGFSDTLNEIAGTISGTGLSTVPAVSGNFAQERQKLLDVYAAKQGQVLYSQSHPQDPDQGQASCASTVYWAYKKAFGNAFTNSNPNTFNFAADWLPYGTDETHGLSHDFDLIFSNNGTGLTQDEVNQLQVGDVMLYKFAGSDRYPEIPLSMQHADMYAGDGKVWNQGGSPEYGPNLQPLYADSVRNVMRWHRWNTGGSVEPTGTTGNNSYSINSASDKKLLDEYSKLYKEFGNDMNQIPTSSTAARFTRYKTLKKMFDKDYNEYINLKNRYGSKGSSYTPSGNIDAKNWGRYNSLRTRYGGSSGLAIGYNPKNLSGRVLKKFAPSRYVYGSKKGTPFKFGGGSSRGTRRANIIRFGGASGISTQQPIRMKTVSMLNTVKSNVTSANGNGIDPNLVNKLLDAISVVLQTIASNTAPIGQIYTVLSDYISSSKSNKPVTVQNNTNAQEMDASLADLVNTLSAIAKG